MSSGLFFDMQNLQKLAASTTFKILLKIIYAKKIGCRRRLEDGKKRVGEKYATNLKKETDKMEDGETRNGYIHILLVNHVCIVLTFHVHTIYVISLCGKHLKKIYIPSFHHFWNKNSASQFDFIQSFQKKGYKVKELKDKRHDSSRKNLQQQLIFHKI